MAVASGFGLGYAPVAPGTVGSAGALVLGAGLLAAGPAVLAAAAALSCGLGVWAIRRAGVARQDDPAWVVIDEVAGQLVTLCGLARPGWLGLAAAFVLFRALDIGKPGLIGWADRRPGALWIMADDVIAGIAAAGLLCLIP